MWGGVKLGGVASFLAAPGLLQAHNLNRFLLIFLAQVGNEVGKGEKGVR